MNYDDLAAFDGGSIIDEPTLLERLPISARTARDWRKKGILPFIRPPHTKTIIYHWPTVARRLAAMQKGGE